MSEAEYAPRSTQLTHGGVGTPLYMPPEQWRTEQVTVATDTCALDCMLYEMAAGQRVAAMIVRLVHHAEIISLKGSSYRLKGKEGFTTSSGMMLQSGGEDDSA